MVPAGLLDEAVYAGTELLVEFADVDHWYQPDEVGDEDGLPEAEVVDLEAEDVVDEDLEVVVTALVVVVVEEEQEPALTENCIESVRAKLVWFLLF